MQRPALLLALAVLLLPSIARASCMAMPLSHQVVPADGTVDFPTNGVIRVFFTAWPRELRERAVEEYRLRSPDGSLVPLQGDSLAFTLALKPSQELLANSTYVLESVFAYRDGRLLSDDERWRPSRGRQAASGEPAKEQRRVWFPLLAFRTGDGPDAHTPATPGIQKATWFSHREGAVVAVTIEDPAELAATDLLGLELKGQGLVWLGDHQSWPVALGQAPAGVLTQQARLGFGDCEPDGVFFETRRSPSVRVFSMSAAGKDSKRGPWTQAIPSRPSGLPIEEVNESSLRRRADIPETKLESFFSPSATEPGPGSLPGPAGCPHGLESVESRFLTSHRESQARYQRDLGILGDRVWAIVEEGTTEEVSLASWDSTLEARGVERLANGRERIVFLPVEGDPHLVQAKREKNGEIRVWRSIAEGPALWERRLPDEHGESVPFLLEGQGRVLVGWSRKRTVGERYESWPRWVILELEHGEIVGQGELGSLGPVSGMRGMGWNGEHFALVWEWDGGKRGDPEATTPDPTSGAWMALVRPDGGISGHIRLPTERMVGNLVPTPEGWIASWVHDGNALAWLDKEGRVVEGPWTLGFGGIGFIGDIAVQGELVALAGAGGWGDPASVVLVDREGGVSPVFDLGHGRPSRGASIEAFGEGFIVGYGTSLHPEQGPVFALERLGCRDKPPLGPLILLAPPKVSTP